MKPQPSAETLKRLLKNQGKNVPLINLRPNLNQPQDSLLTLINTMPIAEGPLVSIRIPLEEPPIQTLLNLAVRYNHLVDVLHKTLFTHVIKLEKVPSPDPQKSEDIVQGATS